MGFYTLFYTAQLLLSEIVLSFSAYGKVQITLYTVLFMICGGIILGAATSLFREKAARAVSFAVSSVLFLFYAVNTVYQHIFTSFLSITQLSMGGDAITSFWRETLIGTWESIVYLILHFLPVVFLIIAKKKKFPGDHKRLNIRGFAIMIALFAALHAGTVLLINRTAGTAYSPADIYNDTFILNMSEQHFGALTSTRLEIRNMTFGSGGGSIIIDPEPTDEPEPVVEYGYNIDESLDFAALAESTNDKTLKSLDSYFGSVRGTQKNEYTGMFKDYNVIVVCCESFSKYLIDEERTPALYRMATEGFVVPDYYSTICDNTSNSEYTLLTGLIPDTSLLKKGWSAFYKYNSCVASEDNYMPMTLGNQMQAAGVRSLGFHNYRGTYYGRNKTHPNFGMNFKYWSNGLKKSSTYTWPTSDLEMMEQAMPVLLTPNEEGEIERFSAYFLTFSGHLEYNFSSNKLAKKNKAVSDGMDMSEGARAYISGNQELEYAMEYMLTALEEAGQLDNTLIVLTQDHYPYKLGLTKLSEVAGYSLNADAVGKEFNQYAGAFLMWSGSMEEPVYVDCPVCELDILPTVCNLLGLDYDSRLLMGKDIFSDSEHVAILLDRSFVTKDYFYNANNGTVTMRTEGAAEPDQEEIDALVAQIKNKFTVSTEILYNDYYSHVFGKAD